jgi:hypothetical protein
MKLTRKLPIVMIAVLLGITARVSAADETSQYPQAGKPSAAKQRACRADVRKFCKDIKPGEGRIIACLKANATKLSQECAARLDKAATGQAREQEQEEGNSSGY